MIHTPYDGSSKLFQIGLAQLDVKDWLDVDEHYDAQIAEKHKLYKEVPEKVLVAENGTEAAQVEVFELIQNHVHQTRHPGAGKGPALAGAEFARKKLDPRLSGDDRVGGGDEEAGSWERYGALAQAALLIQEDLVIMRKSPEGWRLVAASVCFPSAWNLLEKFKKPLSEIHAPVPEFGSGSRNASLIERMFDNLNPERSVVRWNWSLYGDGELYHPHSDNNAHRRFGAEGDIKGKVFFRLERQTLRKLPISGDILFTIRIYIDPLEAIARQPNAAELARSIESQILDLTDEQISYKGIADERERLCTRLRQIQIEHTK